MRCRNPLVIFGIIVLLLTFCFPGSSLAADKVITLKFASYLPGPQHCNRTSQESIAELEQRTNGRVKVKLFPGGSLPKAPAMIKAIETGITDIGRSHIS